MYRNPDSSSRQKVNHMNVQVIPTVGVDGGNADKNKNSILKHFRNLVNETASKASFLAAFQRSDAPDVSEVI